MMSFNFPTQGSYFMKLDYYEKGGGEEVEFFQADDPAGNTNRRLVNDGSELVVYRDDTIMINATSVVVQTENRIVCLANLVNATPDSWNVIVTPECGEASRSQLDDALKIVTPPVGTVEWSVSSSSQDSAGPQGGEFSPDTHNFLIQNWGTAALDWYVAKGGYVDWLDLPATSYGTLASRAIVPVPVTINDKADQLEPGVYNCPLIFSVACLPGTGSPTKRYDVELLVSYKSDFNLDKQVNITDLKNLGDNWLDPFDLEDLAIFAAEWMLTVP